MYNMNAFSDPFEPVNKSSIASIHYPSRYSDAQLYQQRRRSNRVSKPSSAGNSPHNVQAIERRRTTAAHWLSRQRSSLSQGIAGLTQAMSSRPISWHPSSRANVRTPASSTYERVDIPSNTYVEQSYVTAEMHGLVTPMSYPYPGEPLQQDFFPYLDNLQQDQFTPQSEIRHSCQSDFAQNTWGDQVPGHGSCFFQGSVCQPEHSMYPSQDRIHTTAPPTPDFLPIQNFPSPEPIAETSNSFVLLDSRPSASDLVGMGLYDLPSPTQRTKSLILEESFVPDDSDGEEEEEKEEGTEEGEASGAQREGGMKDEIDVPNPMSISTAPLPKTTNQNEDPATDQRPSQEQPDTLVLQSSLQGPFDPYTQYFPELSWPGVSQPAPCGWV